MGSIADLDRLVDWFIEHNSGVIVALSGGVDSAIVALAAKIALDKRAMAITANYKTLASEELESAKSVAREIGINHKIIEYSELDNSLFRKNDELRCYYCRSELAKRLVLYGKQVGISLITDGTQVDDASDIRPGMRAITESGIKSPLVEVGLDKSSIRSIAKAYGLSVFDRPSNSCLASRLPMGVEVTAERLAKIENAEEVVKRLFHVRQVRVRDHGEIARIEVGVGEISRLFDRNKLITLDLKLRMLGFKYVCLDARGYRTGNLVILD
jgi:uncharacterized protein